MNLQACSFEQHRRTDAHVKVVDAFLSRAKPLLRILTPVSNDDDQLLSGSVSQINTWLRVWRASLSSSFRAASQHMSTEHYIDPDVADIYRRTIRKHDCNHD